jgi:hypothetical protein
MTGLRRGLPGVLAGVAPSGAMRKAAARVLLIATALGIIESVAGVFGTDDGPAAIRTVFLLVMNWFGAAFAFSGYALAWRMSWAKERYWTRVLAAAGTVFVPQGIIVWACALALGARLGPETIWLFVANTFLFSSAFIAAFVAPNMDAARRSSGPSRAVGGDTFMGRLPFRLRTAELWALQAEDHYLRAITSQGEALIRLRLADAIRELDVDKGARTHRSWWVAKAAVCDVRRADGRVRSVVLPDGREALVSRSCADALRADGWFDRPHPAP